MIARRCPLARLGEHAAATIEHLSVAAIARKWKAAVLTGCIRDYVFRLRRALSNRSSSEGAWELGDDTGARFGPIAFRLSTSGRCEDFARNPMWLRVQEVRGRGQTVFHSSTNNRDRRKHSVRDGPD